MARRREALQVSLLLFILLVAFFGKAIFTGQKLLPADIAYTDPVYADHAPPGFAGPHNILLYDQAYQFYPWRVQISQAVRQGSLPFWNPYVYCGAPLLAEDQPAVFYPLNVLSYALSPADATLFTALARLFVAGLATYWFARACARQRGGAHAGTRTIGRVRFGALISAITFTFSGFMVVWLGHPHTNVAAWLPALFLTLEWLCQKTSLRHVALVALVIACQLTGGHTETALYALSAGGLYYLLCLLGKWTNGRKLESVTSGHPSVGRGSHALRGDSRRNFGSAETSEFGIANSAQGSAQESARTLAVRVLALTAAVTLGFALASVHLLPFGEWLQQSAELQFRTGTGSLRLSSLGPKHWLAGILPLVLPNVFGNPTWPGEYHSFFPGWNFVEQTAYVGVIALALAAVAIIVRLRRGAKGERQIWVLAGLAVVSLGAALRLPIFDWVNQLPLFHIAAYGRLRLIYTFCVSVLAGFGADDLFSQSRSNDAQRVGMWFLGLLIVIGTVIVGVAPGFLSSMVAQVPGPQIRQMLQEGIASAFRIGNLRMSWPLLVAAAGMCVLVLSRSSLVVLQPGRHRLNQQRLRLILTLLVIVDLFALGMDYHGTIQEELAFPETPALRLVKSDQGIFRVAATNVDLMPNTSMIHGLQDVRGLDFPTDRYREFSLALGGRDWLGYGLLLTEQLRPRLLGMLNTKYILTSSALEAETLQSLRLLARDGEVRVYENLTCLPRAFVVHRVRVCEGGTDALQILQDPGFDLGAEIVLEKPPPVDSVEVVGRQDSSAEPGSVTQATAQITRYQPNHVTIQARTPCNGFLFLSDSYYPGWRAYVGGVESEIYRANYAFRAVYLPAGEHIVEFIYEPRSFKLASVISLCALLGTVILLAKSGSRGVGRLLRSDHGVSGT